MDSMFMRSLQGRSMCLRLVKRRSLIVSLALQIHSVFFPTLGQMIFNTRNIRSLMLNAIHFEVSSRVISLSFYTKYN